MNTSEALRLEAFFNPGPLLLDPSSDLGLVPLDRPAFGPLGGPTEGAEEPTDMIDMIGNTEACVDKFGDPGACPQICWEPGGLGSLEQLPFECSLILRAQPARPSGRRPRLDPLFPLPPIRRLPASNASAVDAEHASYVNRLISFGQKTERPFAPPLENLRASIRSHDPPPARTYRTFIMQESIVFAFFTELPGGADRRTHGA